MRATMTLQGAKELESAFKQIERKVAKKVVRKAVRAGAKPVRDQAKANASGIVGGELGGAISKAMTVRAQKKQWPGGYGVNVLINPNKADQFVYYTGGSRSNLATRKFDKSSGKRHFIPAAVEYGHVGPGKTGTGAPKVARPKPFMRKAFDAKSQEAMRTTERALWKGIEQAAREAPKVT